MRRAVARQRTSLVSRFLREARAAVASGASTWRGSRRGDARVGRAVHGHGVPRGQRSRGAASRSAARCRSSRPSTTCSRPARPRRGARAGIVHRDLKPANLFLTQRPTATALHQGARLRHLQGRRRWPERSPWRRARMRSSARRSTCRRSRCEPPATSTREPTSGRLARRSTSCSTGVVPFAAQTLLDLAYRIANEDPPPLRTRRPEIPRGLEVTVLRCLEKNRDRRFPDAQSLAVALAEFRPRAPDRADRATDDEAADDKTVVESLDVSSPGAVSSDELETKIMSVSRRHRLSDRTRGRRDGKRNPAVGQRRCDPTIQRCGRDSREHRAPIRPDGDGHGTDSDAAPRPSLGALPVDADNARDPEGKRVELGSFSTPHEGTTAPHRVSGLARVRWRRLVRPYLALAVA